MPKYRLVHKCDVCGKIYRSEFWPNHYADSLFTMLCGRCGSINSFVRVAAKPKFFGLLGWTEKKWRKSGNKRALGKIRDWWDSRSNFEQFWLFWFVVALVGLGVVGLGLLIFGRGE